MQQRIVKWDYRPFIERQCDAINKADELANKGIILHVHNIYRCHASVNIMDVQYNEKLVIRLEGEYGRL